MKTQVVQLEQPSVAPDMELFLDESLSQIPNIDLKEIHSLSRFLPVIVLIPRATAKDQVARCTTMTPSGRSSETTKLLGVFGQAIDRFKSKSAEPTFAFGDVTVRFSAMEVLRNGAPVVLAAMEFKTLKYLVQNAGRVVSRNELLNEVWGYENYYPCTRTVDNHILYLRRKLERDPSRPVHFRTVRRAGYKFLP
jgi:DNA-binding response OmpR family regulator